MLESIKEETSSEYSESNSNNNLNTNYTSNFNCYTETENNMLFSPIECDDELNEDQKDFKEKKNFSQIQGNNKSTLKKKNKNIKKLKIILLGELGVGKSTLINRYINNKFEILRQSLSDPEYKIKNFEIDDNTIAELSIHDTIHEEKLGKITKNYYKDAHGAIIVFDLTNDESFEKVKNWLNEINSNAPKDIIICLLGNKSDLTMDRKVDYEIAKKIAKDDLYYEVSAKTGNNVSLCFEQLTYVIIKKQNEEEKNPDKEIRGIEGRKSTRLSDIESMNKYSLRKKKCC